MPRKSTSSMGSVSGESIHSVPAIVQGGHNRTTASTATICNASITATTTSGSNTPAMASARHPTWGVYLHPSVFRVHATGRDVFLSLEKNGALPTLEDYMGSSAINSAGDAKGDYTNNGGGASVGGSSGNTNGTTSDLASSALAHMHMLGAAAAQRERTAAVTAASPLLPPVPQLYPASPASAQPSLSGNFPSVSFKDPTAATSSSTTPTFQTPQSTPHMLLSYASSGAHPQLVSFDYQLCVATPIERPEDPAALKAIQRDPLVLQLKSSRVNSLEAVLPAAASHAPLTPAQLHSAGHDMYLAGPPSLSSTAAAAAAGPGRERELAELAAALEVENSSAHAESTQPPQEEQNQRKRLRRWQAEQVQRALHGSRRCAELQLFFYQPAPHRGVVSGRVTDQRVGSGEGTGLQGSALLPGLDIALASLAEGEEGSFLVAAPQGYYYTGPEKKSIAAVAPINNNANGTSGASNGSTGCNGGGNNGVSTTAESGSPGPLADSRANRSSSGGVGDSQLGCSGHLTMSGAYSRGTCSSRSSSTSSSSSSSAASSSLVDVPGAKRRGSSFRHMLDKVTHRHKHKRDTTGGLGADQQGKHQHHQQRLRSVSNTGVVETPAPTVNAASPQTALQLVKYSADDHVLCYRLRLRQRVPLASIVPLSTSMSMSFIAMRGYGDIVEVPRPLSCMRAALRDQVMMAATATAAASTRGEEAAAAASDNRSAAGSMNPFVYFLRSNFAADVLPVVERMMATTASAAASTSSQTPLLSAAAADRPMPLVATFTPLEAYDSVAGSWNANGDGGVGQAPRIRAASPSNSLPNLSLPTPHLAFAAAAAATSGSGAAVADVEMHVQRVLRDDKTVLAARAASYVATLYVLGSHCLSREVRRADSSDGNNNLSSAAQSRVEGQQFESFSLAAAVAAWATAADDLPHRSSAALRYLERDFLAFHTLSCTVPVGIEAYSPLTQSYYPVISTTGSTLAPMTSQQHSSSPPRHLLTIGSVATPCWLDMALEAAPRHGSTAVVVHLLSDASDEVFVGRVLHDMRCEAQRMLEEAARARRQRALLTAAVTAEASAPASRTEHSHRVQDGAEDSLRHCHGVITATAGTAGAPPSLLGSAAVSPAHRSLTGEPGSNGYNSTAALVAATSGTPNTHAAAGGSVPCSAAVSVATVGLDVASGSGSHYTRGDTAAYRRATAPSTLQRRSESMYRVVIDSPLPPVSGGGTSSYSASTVTADGQAMPVIVNGSSSSSSSIASPAGTPLGPPAPGHFFFANPASACAAVRRLLIEVCGLMQYYVTARGARLRAGAEALAIATSHRASLALSMSESGVTAAPLDAAMRRVLRPGLDTSIAPESESGAALPVAAFDRVLAVTAVTQPMAVVQDYLLRQHPRFGRRAAAGTQPACLNPLLLGSTAATAAAAGAGPSSPGTASPLSLSVVAMAATVLPSPPMAPELREHYVLRRILLKALKRLYTAIFLLTFNVDEAATRPSSLSPRYDHYFPSGSAPVQPLATTVAATAAAVTEAKAGNDRNSAATDDATSGRTSCTSSPDPLQTCRRRRYSYLAECYHYVALLYAELDGTDGHALDACAAALHYAPREVPLWSLRAVLLARRRQYAAAAADLDTALALNQIQLQEEKERDQDGGGERTMDNEFEQTAEAREWDALLRLQRRGVTELLLDISGGTVTAAAVTAAAAAAIGSSASGLPGFGGSSSSGGIGTTGGGGTCSGGGGAGASVTEVPVLGSALLAHNGAGSVLH